MSSFHSKYLTDVGRDNVVDIATRYDSTVRRLNPSGSEIFRIRPYRPWGLPSLLHNEYRFSSPGIKRPEN